VRLDAEALNNQRCGASTERKTVISIGNISDGDPAAAALEVHGAVASENGGDCGYSRRDEGEREPAEVRLSA